MDPAEYTACDATELAQLLAAREVAEEEVREAALRAIEAVEPRLNAIVSGPYEDASAAAEGALAGVPFAVKDTLPETGRPLRFGSRLLDGYVGRRDATLGERFRAAGLVSLVRTATPEFAFNVDTAPVMHGPTRNPWNPARSPGGSSGGAAALVASRALPLAHANDGGGSIRLPAAWCGLVGLKPTRGRVPIGPAVGEAVSGFAHEFALTRTVRDAAALLDAVSGPAPGDRYYVARPSQSFAEALRGEPPPLRVAVHSESFFGTETGQETRAAVQQTAATLEQLGHRVEEACPALPTARLLECLEIVWSVDLAGLAATFARVAGRPAGPADVEAASWACIRRGRETSALELEYAASVANSIARRWGAFLDDYDVLLCPTAATPAQVSGTPDQNGAHITSARDWIDAVFGAGGFTPVANVTGQPSISVPVAEDADGAPLGVMLTAQALHEDVLLRVAAELEQAMPWSQRRPAVDAAAARV